MQLASGRIGIVILLVLAWNVVAVAAPIITVEAKEGEKTTGLLNERTSHERLCVTIEHGSLTRIRSFAWSEVQSVVSQNGQPLTPRDLQKLAARESSSPAPPAPPVTRWTRAEITMAELAWQLLGFGNWDEK